MKKILFGLFLLIAGFAVNAQDYKQAKKLLEKKDLAGAKTQIDGYVAANPDKAEGLYYKGKIYAAIAADPTMSGTVPDAAKTAFESFKQAIERKETSNDLKLLEATNTIKFYEPLFDLRSIFFKLGETARNTAYTTQKTSDYEAALNNFMNAEAVGKYASDIKIADVPAIDTIVVLNIGAAAANAGKEATALKYFKRLIDANIKGAEFDYPYEWVTEYYFNKKDYENFLKYQAKGVASSPNDKYLNGVLVDYYSNIKDYPNLFKSYETLISKNPDSSSYRNNYAAEMFNYAYKQGAGKVENKDVLLKNIVTQLNQVLAKNPNDIRANWLMGQYYYNSGVENKLTMKDDFAKALGYINKDIPQLEATSLKEDKSMYKSMVNLGATISEQLHQADRVKFYQAKYDEADKKFVNK
jgi:tetratricopeptide (TPR) repeat protein